MAKTFEFQKDLKRLPIPSLNHTKELYLQSCKPFFETAQEAKEYSDIVSDFFTSGGLAENLQSRLIAYDKTQKNSWLEAWWLKYAYLSWRNSLLVHSNWFVLTQNLPNLKRFVPFNEEFSGIQIARAAGFANCFLDYKDLIDRQELEPEKTKTGYLDMSQYTRLFGVTRVPKPECDVLVGLHPCKSQHIIVLVKDQIFVVYVYDQKTGARISDKEMERQFQECINRTLSGKRMQPPVCILSGQHRDKWAEHHGILLQTSPKNMESFAFIESAIFAVSLDHRILPQGVSNLAKNVFHGFNGHNRWFDKSLTIVVTSDGRLGIHGEHSPCDALVPAMLVDFAVSKESTKKAEELPFKSSIKPIQKIEWVLANDSEQWFQDAQTYINETISDSDLEVLHYENYGSDFIKKMGRVSPDAYSQLCLQLAFYRIHGYFAGVYETASTRQFLHGRTETCRSLTNEAAEFMKTFEDPKTTVPVKYAAFQKAAKAHIAYITKASSGMGVDRHLLGLKLCMKQGESHPIYSHPIFAKSSRWQLSTSALFSGERLMGTGFGTVYPDGYGMNYMLGKNIIKIGIESKVSCPETSTLKFIQTLSKVYDDIGVMCKTMSETPAAKL